MLSRMLGAKAEPHMLIVFILTGSLNGQFKNTKISTDCIHTTGCYWVSLADEVVDFSFYGLTVYSARVVCMNDMWKWELIANSSFQEVVPRLLHKLICTRMAY